MARSGHSAGSVPTARSPENGMRPIGKSKAPPRRAATLPVHGILNHVSRALPGLLSATRGEGQRDRPDFTPLHFALFLPWIRSGPCPDQKPLPTRRTPFEGVVSRGGSGP